ncbi:MAG: phospholipase D-like domain-containing protein, partial [Acidobacteriota bacterium]
ASFENCRTPLINLIRQETVGLDVAFWFMEDGRISAEIVKRWQAGVPVRVIMDQRALPAYGGTHPVEVTILQQLAAAGIPIRQRSLSASDILHWKMMLFSGQNIVEFSGANYSPTAFVPEAPYVNFEDEAIFFTDDAKVVNSFRTKYDDLWVDTTIYKDYANILNPPARVYPIFPKDPELNFPQQESYANRVLGKYAKETKGVDVIMFRLTDERETNAVLATIQRGVPVRLITDLDEYRVPKRQWVSYNLDRLWASGVKFRVRAHLGLNHQKLVLFNSQRLSVFGSSNWTTPSDNKQQEHNYFTVKPWIFDYFVNQFQRKWCSGPWPGGMPDDCVGRQNPVGSAETADFTPLPADKPVNTSPVNGSLTTATTAVKLKWDGGYFAHYYDVYFGLDPNPPLYQANLHLGPKDFGTGATQSLLLPTLQPGTTYYWRVASRTMAGLRTVGPIWSFTPKGIPPPPPPPPAGAVTQILWSSDVQPAAVFGRWSAIADPTAAGGVALWNPDKANAKIAPALAAPATYFEATFDAMKGVPYHIWIRLRAQANSLSNNSVHVQFGDSVDPFGTASYRIGTAASQEIVLQGTTLAGWGWADNSTATKFGSDIYFAATGPHTIRVQQRTDGPVIDQIVLSPDTFIRNAPGAARMDGTVLASTLSGVPAPARPTLADPWRGADIGVVGINGLAGSDPASGNVTVIAGGGDAWGAADGMYFAWQPLTGDGSIIAHLSSVQKAVSWSRAGVMIRESLSPGSPNAFMFLSAGSLTGVQRRRAEGGATFATVLSSTASAPGWVRLDRAGDVLTAYVSADGVKWTFAGSDTVPMAATVYAGLAGTSATVTATSTSTFDSVSVVPGTPAAPVNPPVLPPLPDGWARADVGNVGLTGDTSFDLPTSTFTMKGAGSDIWGSADAFAFTWRAMTGDGVITARVRKIQTINAASKGGVMIRQSLDAGAANVFMGVTPSKGSTFQRRLSAGGATTASVDPLVKAPYWVKLERIGDLFNAYESGDGVNWTLVGSDTVAMDATVLVGLATVSRDPMNTTTALFDDVRVP